MKRWFAPPVDWAPVSFPEAAPITQKGRRLLLCTSTAARRLCIKGRCRVQYHLTEPDCAHLIAETVQRVLHLMAQGLLSIDVSAVLPLAQAAEAHRRMESRSHLGKLLLRIQEEEGL